MLKTILYRVVLRANVASATLGNRFNATMSVAYSSETLNETFVQNEVKRQVPEARRRLIASILRVDHAGELSADRIYAGQLVILRGNPRVGPVIEEMWMEEREHLDTMERLLAKHEVAPTVFASLCSAAGFMLGTSTALIGEKGAMACTIAVEELIGGHYNDQIKELVQDDPSANADLLKIISRLRDEELEHHDTGVAYKGLEAPFYQALKNVIQTGCRAAIWVTQRI